MLPLSLPKLCLDGKLLDFVDKWKHLGHVFSCDMGSSGAIEVELRRFFSVFNSFYHLFQRSTPLMLCRLLQAFAAVFYGCQLWNCNDNQLHRLCVACNDVIRRICNVRRGCHVDTMLYATGLLLLLVLLRKRSFSLCRHS